MSNFFAKNTQTDGEYIKILNIIRKIAIANNLFENVFVLESLLYKVRGELQKKKIKILLLLILMKIKIIFIL